MKVMLLKALVVADPVGNVAQLVTSQCKRLAHQRVVATTGEQTVSLVAELQPEVLVVSLEIMRPPIDKLVPRLIQAASDILIIATFRELSVPKMEQLNRLGVDDFVAQPINATEIFRAVSRRFNTAFRQFARFDCKTTVQRIDGKLLGHMVNISEGGMCLNLLTAVAPDESILVQIDLPGVALPVRTRFRVLSVAAAEPPAKSQARGQFENLRGAEQERLIAFLQTLEDLQESLPHT